jgi:translocation and assembly module TamB
LTIGQQVSELSTACFALIEDSRACVDANWKAASGLVSAVTLTGFPLSQLSGMLAEEIVLTHLADGKADFQVDGEGLFGTVDFKLTPGQVFFADEDTALFSTEKSEMGFKLEGSAVSAGHADIPIIGQGEIDFDFSLTEVDRGLDAPLHGDLRIDLADLNVLSIFLPLADEIAGRFNSELQLSGTAGNPHFSGFVSLDEGKLVNMASGLAFSEIQLSGTVAGNDETRLFGSFRATEGHGELEAVLDFSESLSPRASLGISGENLTVLKSKNLTVIADPDIRLAWQNNALEIDGRLVIPRAKIAPDVIPLTQATESPDLVIVAGASSENGSEQASAKDLSLSGNLEVVLGDGVIVDLDLAEFGVTGSVEFSWLDQLIPVANGNYFMSGEILAYGQLLEISEGNIGFPQVPADNPHLNIRAERRIFGNSEIRRAGVFITGTLKRPVVEPYTDPMTNRERAQTLLVTGSDFNMERGVGAVDIGTYIAPRVFVSYGIGVFEDENVIGIRYDLGSNWGIKATSGERQTGLDISYTLER